MNSKSERNTTPPTMEELKATQQSRLRMSLDRAANIQRSVTLTEENWLGLTRALALTADAVLRLQETMDRMTTAEQLDEKLNAQASTLMAQHSEAVQELQTAVRELTQVSEQHLEWMCQTMKETVQKTEWNQEKLLKEFGKQAGRVSGEYSSQLSQVTDSIRESAVTMKLQMYLPTIILVLWELARHLFLRG